MIPHQLLDLSGIAGRALFIGDIHGHYDMLMNKLAEINFDESKDHLIAVGDIVDRGTQPFEVMALIGKPWFHRIVGNHEQMVMVASTGLKAAIRHHTLYGGEWYERITVEEDRRTIANLLMDAPVAMTVLTPGGKKIGVVHANMLGNDWDAFVRMLETDKRGDVIEYAMWNRDRAQIAKANLPLGLSDAAPPAMLAPIKNVDYVYFGHTPMINPVRIENMFWIDTGVYGKFTIGWPDAL